MLAGGTGDPGAPDARSVDADVFTLGLPVLAMGYGARQMALTLGGQLLGTQLTDRSAQISFADSPLFEGLGESERFFSRVDSLELPEGFGAIAFSDGGLVPAFACEERKLYALQFYAEANDPDGLQILANFAGTICGCEPWWSMEAFLERAEARIRKDIGGGSALIAISGGVDSAVCATLLHRAIGDRLKCVFIDTGLMRKGEPALVTSAFREALGMELTCIDASERILARLEGVCSPAAKRGRAEIIAVLRKRRAPRRAWTAWPWAPSTRTCSPAPPGERPDSRSAWSLCACCSRMKCGSWATCWACLRS